jgi:hypothetical protein
MDIQQNWMFLMQNNCKTLHQVIFDVLILI